MSSTRTGNVGRVIDRMTTLKALLLPQKGKYPVEHFQSVDFVN